MNRVIKPKEAVKISKELRNREKKIVLVGGCFDILHLGHIKFLESAKKLGGFLFVMLEADRTVQKLKGEGRPVNSQAERAKILTSLKMVDYVILLPMMKSDLSYDKLITQIKPDFIATTEKDQNIHHKERQAKLTNTRIKFVIKRVKNKSTTKLFKLIKNV